MPRPKRITSSYKLLVASIGVASVTYSSCGMQVANLVACPADQCNYGGGGGAGSGVGGSPADGGTDGAMTGTGGAGGN